MAPGQTVHEIRKYPNRRFYDATDRKHLSMEDLHALILDGHEVRITDSKSGEDITATVLTQIILKLDTTKLQLFPVALLHRLIRANEQVVGDFVSNYFQQALSFLMDAQRNLESQARKGFAGAAPGIPPGIPSWAEAMPLYQSFWPGATGRSPDAPDEGLRSELDAVKEQLRELQEALARRSEGSDSDAGAGT